MSVVHRLQKSCKLKIAAAPPRLYYWVGDVFLAAKMKSWAELYSIMVMYFCSAPKEMALTTTRAVVLLLPVLLLSVGK